MLTLNPVHIDVSATILVRQGMPRVCLNRRSDGPNQRLLSSQCSRRGELRANRYDAASTNSVVGSPGTNTPMTPSARQSTPSEVRIGRVMTLRSVVMAMTPSLHCWSPSNASHETLECQFMNVPVGLSFHAHTCKV